MDYVKCYGCDKELRACKKKGWLVSQTSQRKSSYRRGQVEPSTACAKALRWESTWCVSGTENGFITGKGKRWRGWSQRCRQGLEHVGLIIMARSKSLCLCSGSCCRSFLNKEWHYLIKWVNNLICPIKQLCERWVWPIALHPFYRWGNGGTWWFRASSICLDLDSDSPQLAIWAPLSFNSEALSTDYDAA